jgi:hypothetical protein
VPLISADCYIQILSQVAIRLDDLTVSSLSAAHPVELTLLAAPTRILSRYVEYRYSAPGIERRAGSTEEERENERILDAYLVVCAKSVFQIGYLLPNCLAKAEESLPCQVVEDARKAWTSLLENSSGGANLIEVVLERMKELLIDTTTVAS